MAGGLLWKGLANATVYFKTVDEAVAQRAELGDRRFRLEGLVQPGSVKGTDDGVDFVVAEDDGEITSAPRRRPARVVPAEHSRRARRAASTASVYRATASW